MKMIYDVNQRPKFGANLLYALQQLLAIMAATLVVPVITNGNIQTAIDNGTINWQLTAPMDQARQERPSPYTERMP